ncbi:hypothetical protein SAMN03080598_02501 [Algoriphagus boritolerans DSM 17298 = JCM 18970]|uniref:Uncharacterized protein n=1 Tax=Algoriphagus boritolerans DSM 17298 = JCM 18970 TaxID=1120964 RepID=A0A1H5XFR6_9BACT|nr:hypothetical protein SAMN03080598_02501 [Algoriphagus boritolerans DSM 17298 = JCM 18970]
MNAFSPQGRICNSTLLFSGICNPETHCRQSSDWCLPICSLQTAFLLPLRSALLFHCAGIHISFQANNLGQRWVLPSFSFPGLRRASLPGAIEKFDHSVLNPWTCRFNNTCIFKPWIIHHSSFIIHHSSFLIQHSNPPRHQLPLPHHTTAPRSMAF